MSRPSRPVKHYIAFRTAVLDMSASTRQWASAYCSHDDEEQPVRAFPTDRDVEMTFANLPDGALGTSTIESKTNFLRAVTAGDVTATARALHVGSTTIVVEVELANDDRLAAKVTQTQIILRPR